MILYQSSAQEAIPFLLVLSSDHITGATGLTPTVTISKNGGAFASPSGAVTEIANGWYKIAGNATDTGTLGALIVHVSVATADVKDDLHEVFAINPQDAVRLGLTSLPNAIAGATGGIPSAQNSNGAVRVDYFLGTALTESIAGQLSGGFKKFFDVTTPAVNLNQVSTFAGGAVASVTGAVGSVTGLTASNLDATISSRMATYTQPPGFLTTTFSSSVGTSTFAGGAVASVTGAVGSVTGAVGSVTGSVGSVVGAVGSVTGNVGGNVIGSVASVTGAVASVTGNVGGSVVGSVGSISGVTFPSHFPLLAIDTSGFVTFNNSGIATAAEITTLQTNIETHGDANWLTATGFAVASSWTPTLASDLVATFASSGVFTTAALANAPSGGGSSITVEQIDAQLSGTHGSGAWGGASGSGANAVTVTVTDGTNPLANVAVRLTNGINNFTASTNNSGVASFSLDAAVYTRSMTRGGYQFTPDTITVSASGNFGAAMSAIVIPTPTDPSTCAVFGTIVLPNGKPAQNVPVTFSLVTSAASKANGVIGAKQITSTTNSSGQLWSADGLYVALTRTDSIDPAGAQWTISCPAAQINSTVALAVATFDIASLIP